MSEEEIINCIKALMQHIRCMRANGYNKINIDCTDLEALKRNN